MCCYIVYGIEVGYCECKDLLAGILGHCDITVEDIRRYNKLYSEYVFDDGESIIIGVGVCADCGVASGDVVSLISDVDTVINVAKNLTIFNHNEIASLLRFHVYVGE